MTMTEVDARFIFQLPDKYSKKDVLKKFKDLAKENHPDKNVDYKYEMSEQVQARDILLLSATSHCEYCKNKGFIRKASGFNIIDVPCSCKNKFF